MRRRRRRSSGRSGDRHEYTLKGGGGTDFRPFFTCLDERASGTSLLLYLTDLAGRFPDQEPPCEVVWVAPKPAEVPFGRLLVIE